MSNPDCRDRDVPPAAKAERAATEMRIDGAHRLDGKAREEDPSALCQTAVAEPCVATAVFAESRSAAERLRIQAGQLADHLRARQREIDHRESQLNARLAQFDNDVRNARLALQTREVELRKREQEIQEGLARPADGEALSMPSGTMGAVSAQEFPDDTSEGSGTPQGDLPALSEGTLEEREQNFEARAAALRNAEQAFRKERKRAEEALEYQRQQIDAHRETSQQAIRQMLAGLERRRESLEADTAGRQGTVPQPSPIPLTGNRQVREAARALQARQRQLDETESLLAEARAETEKLREQLLDDRRKVQEQGRAERQRLAADHRRRLAELDKQRQGLQRRGEHVDQCRAALEQLRSELGRMHRETLDIRLATEELWIQMSGSAPPAVLTRSLGQIRAKLAEHYRLANAELAEQKEELRTIRLQLAEQHEKLVEQKGDLEQWATRRQEDLDQHARRLLAREQEVERQETLFNDLARQWQSEQLGYQQEIRRLRRQVSQSETAALAIA